MSDHQHPAKRGISIVLFLLSLSCSAQGNEASIPQADITKAEILFSGPTEEDLYRTDEMLVSATGSLKPVVLAPSVATVISKEEIEAMGARSLNEVLETVPGLHVAPSSLVGPLFTNYSIRGILTALNPEVLLLINGIPIKENYSGNRSNRFTLPVAMISRVEVVRGPGSAVFGADAFAGTINVITKDGHEINGVQVGLRHGSFDTSDFWVQYGGNHNGWDVIAGFESVRNGSDKEAIIDSDLQSSLDPGFATAASLAPGPMNLDQEIYQVNLGVAKQHWNLRFWGQKMDDAGLGVGTAPVLDPNGSLASEQYMWDVLYQGLELASDWSLDLRVNYSYLKSENNYFLFPPGAVLPIGSDGNVNFTAPAGFTLFTDGLTANPGGISKKVLLEAVTIYDGLAQHKMRFAIGHRRINAEFSETKNFGPGVLDGTQPVVDGTLTDVTGTGFIYAPNTKRELFYLSAQDEWAFARNWELTAGVRYDDYSDFGGTVNPRLALVWQTRFDLVTKILYGRAFRAPTIAELSAQNNPVNTGNPNLDPETIDTMEFAVDYRPTVDLRLNANMFYYEIDGLIEYKAGVAQNARDQKGHGIEMEVDWEANSQFRLTGNLAWQNSEDKMTGSDVANAPQLQAYANIHWKFQPKWSVNAQWFWIGERQRAVGDTRPEIDNYSLVNLTLRRKKIVKDIDLALGIRNVFNEDAREPSDSPIANDYPLNSRAIWAEVRGRF